MRFRFAITCVFSILFSFFGFAQESFVLKGYLGVQGGESFHYELHFNDSNGYANGYSYTFADPKKDVKTTITGFLDRKNKTFSFKETEIIYNHGFQSNATICLIKADLGFVKQDNDQLIFSGAITSSDLANASCSGGTISIMGDDAQKEIFEKTPPSENMPPAPQVSTLPQNVKTTKIIYDTSSATQAIKLSSSKATKEQITEGIDKMYEWKSDSLVIDIWDGGKIDGDRVSLKINDKTILDNYTLVKERNRIVIPYAAGDLTITIKAENEGNESPNTADILLQDGADKYALIAYNKAYKIAIIKLRHL